MKVNKKISLQKFLTVSEADIQSLLHPNQASPGYFLVWLQSLRLPISTV